MHDARWIAACDAEADAEEAVLTARAALRGSDCPRLWELREAGEWYDTMLASSAAEALAEARKNFDRGNYTDDDRDETLWIDIGVHCPETDESDSVTIQSSPDGPDCTEAEHDWQSPYRLVGGIKENPGVWGNGAGLIIHEACLHCGCKKVTNTWGQRPDTGEQGFTTVSYEPHAYDVKG